jgi:predicted HTH domain antitoxin
MHTKTVAISYPEELLGEIGTTPEAFEQELRFLVAAKLFELGRLSSGRAAEIAGMQRVAFLNELGRYRISAFNYSLEELERDIREAQARARNGL